MSRNSLLETGEIVKLHDKIIIESPLFISKFINFDSPFPQTLISAKHLVLVLKN